MSAFPMLHEATMPRITAEHASYADLSRKDELENALTRACNWLRKERPLVRSRETIGIHDIADAKGGRTISINVQA